MGVEEEKIGWPNDHSHIKQEEVEEAGATQSKRHVDHTTDITFVSPQHLAVKTKGYSSPSL